ncbi:unnamed protein product [Calicophoron daubneyi]|uniref:PDZ domain-containing protein n=1 Tax=Calicophoron daubneyi TaxID=300641 RepID=A0AAV2TS72_CALDB
MFGCLPFVKPCGKQIDQIDRRHAKLEQVPDEVLRNFRTLEECRLDANQIKELPKNFFRLERIRCLTLSDNDIKRIPPGLGSFSKLVELDLSRNDISELPSSIRFCESLQIIDISTNPLQSLPAGFCQLRKLRILCMNDISLTELPGDFGSLQMLEKCELRDNCLKSLPDSFAELVNLEFLDLGANEFQVLPPVLGHLSSLGELWMDDNELKSVPEEVGDMKQLQQLDLSENLIDTLPETISGLVSLCDLNLSQNSLNCLPNGIGEMKKLTVLKLNQNQLLSLAPSIGGCSCLQELYLTENFISALPSTIGNLENMYLLNVDQNQLSEIPPQIGQCASLNILSLRENQLHRLPKEIGNCSRLRVLDVSGNKLERLPLSLAQCPLTALWLSQNQAQPVITLQRDVDEVTREEFLTCYLLPQDQMDSQGEFDTTLSPSDLTSFAGPVPQTTQISHMFHDEDAIATEPNYAYESMTTGVTDLQHAGWSGPTEAKTNRPDSITSSTLSSTMMGPSGPAGPESLPQRTTPMSEGAQPAGVHLSPSPRPSITVQSGEGDSVATASSHVHFPSSVKQEEVKDKKLSKDFPKTRHPRLTRRNVDGHTNSRELSISSQASDQTAGEESRGPVSKSPKDSPPKAPYSLNDGVTEDRTNLPTPDGSVLHHPDAWHASEDSFVQSPIVRPSLPGTSPVGSQGWSDDGRQVTGNSEQGQGQALTTESHLNATENVGPPPDTKAATPNVKPRKKLLNAFTIPSSLIPNSLSHPSNRSNSPRTTPKPISVTKKSTAAIHDHAARSNEDANSDEDAYSSGGEEICVISRRVGFTDDVEDNEEKSNQKLIRRDTPHYTKRARIQSKTAEGVDSEEAVLKILEKYRASASPNQSTPKDQNSEVGSALKYLASAMNHTNSGANVSPNQVSDVIPRDETALQRITVHVHRQPGSGLGLSIAGGVGSIPYRNNDQGIFVSRLNPAGLAYVSGLRLNDKILEVNGINLVNVEHHVAVSALRASTDDFHIVVARDPSAEVIPNSPVAAPLSLSPLYPSSKNTSLTALFTQSDDHHRSPSSPVNATLIKCTLVRDVMGLGFSVAGGRGSFLSSADSDRYAYLKKIIISKIVDGGAAYKSGMLQVGDQLVKINGIDVKEARHDQVIALLAGAGSSVELEVLRPVPSPTDAIPSAKKMNGYLTSTGGGGATSSHPNTKTKESWLGTGCSTASDAPCIDPTLLPERPVHLRTEHGYPVDRVAVRLDGGPLGLAIYGGSDISCLPFSSDEPGIFISKISSDGAAQHTGLRVGDRILRVNDIDLRNATHDEAVNALIQPTRELVLEVRRDPTPPGLRRLTISRHPNERFGLRIAGGVPVIDSSNSTGPLGSQMSSLPDDGSIFVTWVAPDGAVSRDGRLKSGDRLLEVNGRWMMGSTLEEALDAFRSAGSTLNLIVCDGPLELALQMGCTASCSTGQNFSVPAPPASSTGPAGSSVDPSEELRGCGVQSNALYQNDSWHQRTSELTRQNACLTVPTQSASPFSTGTSLTPPTVVENLVVEPRPSSVNSLSTDSSSTGPDDSLVVASPVPSYFSENYEDKVQCREHDRPHSSIPILPSYASPAKIGSRRPGDTPSTNGPQPPAGQTTALKL